MRATRAPRGATRTTMIDTAKVHDRRRLHFESFDDLVAEVDRLVAADAAGTLRCAGNWTAGQTFGHLATWINFYFEGFPFSVPWFVKLFLRAKKQAYLRDGMPPGVRIPRTENGTYGTEPLTTAEGAGRLRAAVARLRFEPARFDSPAWGPMSLEERIILNLRHAELHLGFLHPG
jgi:hypothetical protein